MKKSKPKEQHSWILVGDVGGTKVNLALCQVRQGKMRLLFQKRFASAKFKSLEKILDAYRTEIGLTAAAMKKRKVIGASLGVPGPVSDGVCRTVNLPWVVTEKSLSKCLSGLPVLLKNDLEMMALGVGLIEEGAGLKVLRKGKNNKPGNRCLIAPGTGLGEALILELAESRVISASEGGHADFAPTSKVEFELKMHLSKKLGHVSVEHVSSGPGLQRIFEFLSGKHTKKDLVPQIVARAKTSKRSIEAKAFALWLQILGREAGNLTLKSLATGGVYIGGGVVPHLGGLLKSRAFFDAFNAKGPMRSLMQGIPLWLIEDQNCALYGAALAGGRSFC